MSRPTNHRMKIEHITYDETHRRCPFTTKPTAIMNPQPTQSPAQVSMLAGEKRPITMWPVEEATSSQTRPDMTTYIIHAQRREKEAHRERPVLSQRGVEAQRPRRKPVAGTSATPPPPPPQLRRKSNFTESLRECFGSPKSVSQKEPEKKLSLTKIHNVRDAIRAGRLEIAVAPPQNSKANRRAAAPARPHTPVLRPVSPMMAHSKKTPTQPSKFGEFLDRSADVIDETTKDLIGKFKPPFEHLNYPSFGRKSRRNSDGSDISFCCIGEPETEPSQAIQALKTRQRENSHRPSYGGGKGTDPWTHPPPRNCRLCRKPGVRGIRGLCYDCENDFIRPKTQKWEFDDSDEDDIKPPPPPKDAKSFPATKTQDLAADRKFVSHSHSNPNKKERPQPQDSVKTELRMTNTDPYPPVINSRPRYSQEGIIDGGDDERFRGWQTPSMRDEYERTKSTFKSWSDCYGADDYESLGRERERESATPFVDRDQLRDSEFYGFYDELLDDHRPRSPVSRRN